MTSNLDRRARRGAIAAILLCIGVLAVTGVVAVVTLRTPDAAAAPAYATGERVDVPAGWYDASGRTLLIFASRDCGACQRAQPVFTWLREQAQAASAGAVFATPPAPRDGQIAFGEQAGFTPTQIQPADLAPLRLKLVPTVIVVDRQGTILFAREGELRDEDRRALTLALGLPAPAS